MDAGLPGWADWVSIRDSEDPTVRCSGARLQYVLCRAGTVQVTMNLRCLDVIQGVSYWILEKSFDSSTRVGASESDGVVRGRRWSGKDVWLARWRRSIDGSP